MGTRPRDRSPARVQPWESSQRDLSGVPPRPHATSNLLLPLPKHISIRMDLHTRARKHTQRLCQTYVGVQVEVVDSPGVHVVALAGHPPDVQVFEDQALA